MRCAFYMYEVKIIAFKIGVDSGTSGLNLPANLSNDLLVSG